MSHVEQGIQLQIRDIAAVKQSFAAALTERQPNTLWWLVDFTDNIAYENRVKGSTILTIDTGISNVNIGSFYSEWFSLQNAYFAQDKPFDGVQTLQSAIAQIYRWRVPQYFNDIAIAGGGQGVSPQYVFPYQDMNLGIYALTGATTGTFTKGVGPVDSTVCGPGILRIAPHLAAIGAASVVLSLTVVYPDGTTGSMAANIQSGSDLTVSLPLGWTGLTSPYVPDTIGIVSVASTTNFQVGTTVPNLVVIAEDHTMAGQLPAWAAEVAELVAKGTNQLTLQQPTPPGAASPFTNGLRNSYTTAAKVYPLFNDVNAVTNTGGTAGDQVLISFHPDWAQGLVDITSIVHPQIAEGQSRGVEKAESASAPDKSKRPGQAPTPGQPQDVRKAPV